MANQMFNQFHFSPIPMLTSIFAKISIGASGAPTLVTTGGLSKYVASVVRNDEGDYTITLNDTYKYFLGMRGSFVASGGASAPDVSVSAESVATAKTINFLTQAGGVNTDPASGEILYLEILLKNSTAF